jgi:hypothetical protein
LKLVCRDGGRETRRDPPSALRRTSKLPRRKPEPAAARGGDDGDEGDAERPSVAAARTGK